MLLLHPLPSNLPAAQNSDTQQQAHAKWMATGKKVASNPNPLYTYAFEGPDAIIRLRTSRVSRSCPMRTMRPMRCLLPCRAEMAPVLL